MSGFTSQEIINTYVQKIIYGSLSEQLEKTKIIHLYKKTNNTKHKIYN